MQPYNPVSRFGYIMHSSISIRVSQRQHDVCRHCDTACKALVGGGQRFNPDERCKVADSFNVASPDSVTHNWVYDD